MENLRIIRKERKMSLKELGKVIGVAESTISLYESGRREPDYATLTKLAEYFGVTTDYLLGREVEGYKPSGRGIPIAVVGDVAAGIPIEAIEDILDYEEITPEMASTGEFFGLRIKGNSMEPRMREGDVVIVRQQSNAENGDTVVVMVNGDSATVKKIKVGHDGITLIPTNPTYDPMFYSKREVEQLPVRIIGKVVELRAKF